METLRNPFKLQQLQFKAQWRSNATPVEIPTGGPLASHEHTKIRSKDEEGKRPKMDHPDGLLKENGKPVRVCKLGKENPDWPDGYTYLDRFLDDVKKKNNGDVVFFAISVEDYELMAYNMQELRRYIREVQEVVVYYRNVTINDEPAVGAEVKLKD